MSSTVCRIRSRRHHHNGDLTELARDGAPSEEFTAVDLAEVVARALDRVRSRAPP